MKIIAEGTVFRGEKETGHASCAFPGIAVLPGGRWICGFRAAPAKKETVGQHILITFSDDEGKSWSPAVDPFSTPPRVGDHPVSLGGSPDASGGSPEGGSGPSARPGLFRAAYPTALGGDRVLAALCWVDHSNPSLPFFNEKTEGLLDTRIFLAVSEDGGQTWPEPKLMDTSPFQVPTPLTGPVLVLPDGRWAAQFELNKPYDDLSEWRHASVLMFSGDQGGSWPGHAIVSRDPENKIFYWDQRPAVLADGTLLDLFWTYDNRAAAYLNIHARRSADGGRTWSRMWDTGVPGQPAQPVSFADGRVALVYVDRTGVPMIRIRVSADRGQSFPPETEMTLCRPEIDSQTSEKSSMQDTWAEMEKFSLGLPATAALPGGDILIVYYSGPEPDLTDIRWLRVQKK